jgi:hypothetical protein
MGGGWWREARIGAARQFGARHYREFAALEIMGAGVRQVRRLTVPLFVLAAVIALGWLGWGTDTSGALPRRWIGLGAGLAALIYLLARLQALVLGAWLAVPGGCLLARVVRVHASPGALPLGGGCDSGSARHCAHHAPGAAIPAVQPAHGVDRLRVSYIRCVPSCWRTAGG